MMMSLTSLSRSLSLSRRRPFQIRWDRLRRRQPAVPSNAICSSSFVAVPSPPLYVSARSLGHRSVEAKIPRSFPSEAFFFVGRWSSTGPKRSAEGKKGSFLDLKGCQSIEAATGRAFQQLDELDPANLSSFWTIISQMTVDRSRTSQRNRRAREELSSEQRQELMNELVAVFYKTLDAMREFDYRHLTQLALALAKIVREVDGPGRRRSREHTKKILRKILLGHKSYRREKLFLSIGNRALPLLPKFDARCLSNLAYAFAIVGTVPRLEDGRTLFDHVAEQNIPLLKSCQPQDFSNMVWAYEKVGACNPVLFEGVANEIVARDNIDAFKPQALSNILLAYSKSGVPSSKLYGHVANHIVGLDDLGEFNPQNVSNILWAYSKAEESSPRLFQKMANHIIVSDEFNSFNPQNHSNILWAFAMAEVTNPRLFRKVADHLVESNNLDSFNPQDILNTTWAFAKAGESHAALFHRVADHILSLDDLRSFSPKAASQILWAYSKVGIVRNILFKKLHNHMKANLKARC